MSAKVVPFPSVHRCSEHIVIKRGKHRYVCGMCRAPVKLAMKPTDVLMRVSP